MIFRDEEQLILVAGTEQHNHKSRQSCSSQSKITARHIKHKLSTSKVNMTEEQPVGDFGLMTQYFQVPISGGNHWPDLLKIFCENIFCFSNVWVSFCVFITANVDCPAKYWFLSLEKHYPIFLRPSLGSVFLDIISLQKKKNISSKLQIIFFWYSFSRQNQSRRLYDAWYIARYGHY